MSLLIVTVRRDLQGYGLAFVQAVRITSFYVLGEPRRGDNWAARVGRSQPNGAAIA